MTNRSPASNTTFIVIVEFQNRGRLTSKNVDLIISETCKQICTDDTVLRQNEMKRELIAYKSHLFRSEKKKLGLIGKYLPVSLLQERPKRSNFVIEDYVRKCLYLSRDMKARKWKECLRWRAYTQKQEDETRVEYLRMKWSRDHHSFSSNDQSFFQNDV